MFNGAHAWGKGHTPVPPWAPALLALGVIVLGTAGCSSTQSGSGSGLQHYAQTNLVSDIAGGAARQDTNLVNPWGLAFGPTGTVWAADNKSGVATAYTADGTPAGSPVTILPATSSPTGVVANSSADFVVTQGTASAPAQLIFATEEGRLAAWSPTVNATQAISVADRSLAGTVYKGIAMASTGAGSHLFATNFRSGKIDEFDTNFQLVQSFNPDLTIPAGFAPFGITNIGGTLWITFAQQDAAKHDDVPGIGSGFVDTLTPGSTSAVRFISQGALNSPWGVVQARSNFGQFSRDILVGNFGDGLIHAYAPVTAAYLGPLQSSSGVNVVIQGLWSLGFGTGASGEGTDTLFFTAGIPGTATVKTHGLLGTLKPTP